MNKNYISKDLFVITFLFLIISASASSTTDAQTPHEVGLPPEQEARLDEVLERWFMPLFASSTPLHYSARPKWLPASRGARSVIEYLAPEERGGLLSNDAPNNNLRFSVARENTFGISTLFKEPREESYMYNWWRRIVDLIASVLRFL